MPSPGGVVGAMFKRCSWPGAASGKASTSMTSGFSVWVTADVSAGTGVGIGCGSCPVAVPVALDGASSNAGAGVVGASEGVPGLLCVGVRDRCGLRTGMLTAGCIHCSGVMPNRFWVWMTVCL